MPYTTPVIADIARHLNRHKGAFVLDLSAMRTSNISFYARFAAKVFVEDITSELPPKPLEEEVSERKSPLHSFAEERAAGTFDAFMCWDVFNYMGKEDAARLAADMIRLASPGAVVYVLTWTGASMPERPLAYDILEDDKLTYDYASIPRIPAPRWTKSQVSKLFPGFERSRNFLSRTGMEECLLVRKT